MEEFLKNLVYRLVIAVIITMTFTKSVLTIMLPIPQHLDKDIHNRSLVMRNVYHSRSVKYNPDKTELLIKDHLGRLVYVYYDTKCSTISRDYEIRGRLMNLKAEGDSDYYILWIICPRQLNN